MLGDKGKQIIKFMESTGLGLTINQAAMLFYSRKFGYDYARQKLKRMHEQGYLKKYTNKFTGELIYYLDYLDKKPSFHDNAILNVYANLVAAGYTITHFKREPQWLDGKYRSDGFIIAENSKEYRYITVEVDHSSPTNINKYEEIFESGELQRKYEEFPQVVILSDIERNFKSDKFTIVNLDIRCTEFNKLLA